MRVLVAPDAFAGTLTAPEAARAVAEGWARQAPDDQLTTLPMADGGPGFVDVLHDSLGGDVEVVTVSGPLGRPTPVTLLLRDGTAFVESAQACGHPLLDEPDAWNTTTAGVGEAIVAAVDAGATTVVVGLGGSATNDGGAGLLGALGATADVPLDAGVGRPARHHPRRPHRSAEQARRSDPGRRHRRRHTAARDVRRHQDVRAAEGPAEDEILVVDRILDELVVAACGPAPADRRVADQPGAGAAGGQGFALMLLGATTRHGVDFVADAVGLAAACAEHDLVVTGEGTYDHSSRSGKVVHGVATIMQPRPPGRASCWPARSPSGHVRCGRWASSPPTRPPTWSASTARWTTRTVRSPRSPSASPAPGRRAHP